MTNKIQATNSATAFHAAPVTHHRTAEIDGLNIFIAKPARQLRWRFCYCTAFQRRHKCSTASFTGRSGGGPMTIHP